MWHLSVSVGARRAGRALTALAWLLLSALFFLLLSSLTRVDQVPAYAVACFAVLIAISAWRPLIGLLILTTLVPIATWLGRTWHGGIAWPEVFVVAFLAGYAARQVSSTHRDSAGELTSPVWTAIVVVAASLSVRLLFLLETVGGDAWWAQIWSVVSREYFVGPGGFPEVDAAMRLIEGLLLLMAVSAWAAQPGGGPLLVQGVVAGAALAGTVNLWHLWSSAQRQDSPFMTFVRYLRTIRYNRHYADVNAAGSYFVMALFPALALAVRPRRLAALVASGLIVVSLSLSGSRMAGLAGGLGALLGAARALKRIGLTPVGRRLRIVPAIAVMALCATVAVVALFQRNKTPTRAALTIRAEFARTGLRMLATAPLFGIGVGEYYSQSHEFRSPALIHLFPALHENAHNNFLQVLAELGLVGFGAFMWVLVSAAGACARRLAAHPDDWLLRGGCAGVLAFTITWLGGHPLLLDAPAFSFWLLLGVVAGWRTTDPAPNERHSLWRRAGIALAVLTLVSIPLRVRTEVAGADLEHQGIGLSGWHHGEDGVRYRFAGDRSTVFVPSDARAVTVPLRANDQHELIVELSLDGRPADVVRVNSERWFLLNLVLPGRSDAPRFHWLSLRVDGTPAASDYSLKVGKVTPR